ncbi:hypothetical protein H6G91_21330 [Nostoc muscorum FACHB-395]|jgi:hypothetical protein|nr:hypothetical protein [Desmonostoc muscorum FACHB-395]
MKKLLTALLVGFTTLQPPVLACNDEYPLQNKLAYQSHMIEDLDQKIYDVLGDERILSQGKDYCKELGHGYPFSGLVEKINRDTDPSLYVGDPQYKEAFTSNMRHYFTRSLVNAGLYLCPQHASKVQQ